MVFRKALHSYCLSYFPGFLVLVASMFALHSSLLYINVHDHFLSFQIQHAVAGADKAREHLSEDFMSKSSRLYWSIIALGLSGFLLVLLNSDKLRKLKTADSEYDVATKQLEQRQAAMEATLDGIGIFDSNGDLVYMNKAFMNLHAIDSNSSNQFIGKNWKFLCGDGREINEIKEKMMSVLGKDGYWYGGMPIPRQDGTVVHAELSLTLLPDGGMICTARDITEKLESDMQQEALQKQFYQAQKMEAVGRLAGGVAHDFNNILAAMNGYAEFLIEDLDSGSRQHSFAQNILQAGSQARSLVDQMLAFSRQENADSKNFDLISSVNESLSMLQASLPKTIEVISNIQVNSALIDGNSTQISQVIMNLCVNAKDSIEEEGKGTLAIGVKAVDASGYASMGFVKDEFLGSDELPIVRIEDTASGETRMFLNHLVRDQQYIVLSVSDDGCGMSRVIMEHIFEPFFTTKPVDKGTGLGLATVHGVISGHRGAMIVESKIGEGTLFELFFPLAEGSVMVEKTMVIAGQDRTSAHIHLVEDQEEVRDMMMMMLQRLGYEATFTTTGLEALEYLREAGGDVDLVITDHNMPKMTGMEMIYQAHLSCPDLPFILLSGYSEKKLMDLMKEHPAIKAILRKPVSRQSLSQKIEAVLAEHSVKKHVA